MSKEKNLKRKVPKEVTHVTETLEAAGFEAYLVGGCVRDMFLDREPNDWDVTTNAKPDQIIELFEKTVYENDFGTVGVVVSHETSNVDVSPARTADTVQSGGHVTESELMTTSYKPKALIVEVTPYRIEAGYSDHRHPDEIKFSDKLEDDLKRRDFTVNAMSFREGVITDIFGGIKDIESKTIRCVGVPDERFQEDALRMMRAVRFALQLNFTVSHETGESILKNSILLKKISQERIRDEFTKIIMSPNPAAGIEMLHRYGLLKYIVPELEEGIGCEQGGAHVFDVWTHLLQALQHAADKDWPLEIRISALFHDIGKPRTRRAANGRGSKKYTFYGHEVIGARMGKKIMQRMKFSSREMDLVYKLIYNHMFFSDTELITLSAVRRIIQKVGKENIWLLMNIRECDRVGMRKKEAPYRLRKYFAMIEEALHDPVSVAQLKIDGKYMIDELGIKPGPKMGWMLHALLEEVLEDPKKNTVEYLSKMVKKLNKLPEQKLKVLGEKGKDKKEELEEEQVEKLHSKHGVKK